MKIIGSGELPGRIQPETPALRVSADVNRFADILKQAVDQVAAVGAPSAPAAAVRVESATPVMDPSVAGRLDEFLDLLEGYCRKLSNPRVSLKSLESSVQQLEEGRNTLSRELGALEESDGLRDVLNEALVTAEIEIFRFRRGDFLSA